MGWRRRQRRADNQAHRSLEADADRAWDEWHTEQFGEAAPDVKRPAARSVNDFFDALG